MTKQDKIFVSFKFPNRRDRVIFGQANVIKTVHNLLIRSCIGVGRFRILRGGGVGFRILGGGG